MPQLIGVVMPTSGLPVTHKIQHKEGAEERPMPWPSFVSYCQEMISMQLQKTPQGIPPKLVIADMPEVLGCHVSSSALPICSYGPKIYFQLNCWFSGCLKMMARCLALLPALYPPWRPPDRETHLHGWLIVRCIQWEIPWPSSQGCCAIQSLWETYCCGHWLRQICSVTFGLVRENSVAELWISLWDFINGILGNMTFWLGIQVATAGVWWSFSWDPGVGALFAMDILLGDCKFWRTESKPCNGLANFGEMKDEFLLDKGSFAAAIFQWFSNTMVQITAR